jgi:hypothetical protein
LNKRNRLRRDILEDLEAQGKTAELVLLAWSIVEMHLDNVVHRVYGVSALDPKSDKLHRLRVVDKLRLLKRMGLIPDNEFEILQRFKAERDNMFHRGGLFLPNYSEQQKRDLADLAIAAADVGHDLTDKMLRLPSPLAKLETSWK